MHQRHARVHGNKDPVKVTGHFNAVYVATAIRGRSTRGELSKLDHILMPLQGSRTLPRARGANRQSLHGRVFAGTV